MDAARRRQIGAWYTPHPLVDAVVDAVLSGWTGPRAGPVRVIDPACGDGRFLLAADRALRSRGVRADLVGVDVDASAVAAASAALAACQATVVHDDAFGYEPSAPFDLVVGNPPFLSPLAARNAHLATTSSVGSPYADAAIQFLLLGWQRFLRPGGRLGFVLPESVLANRDARSARRAVAADGALCWLWWSPRPVFDAAVRTCAIVAERGAAPRPVRRQHGPEFLVATDAPAVGERWVDAVADLRGVPSLDGVSTGGTVGERASAGAGFRDEFYGVAGALSDVDDGSPLVTSGLIDPGVCHWGSRSVRVAKQRFLAPRVDLDALAPRVRKWADRQLVPKVLVASQTKVIEAVADPTGVLIGGVPVVAVVPRSGALDDVWRLAAALTNPVTSAALARAVGGTGLSADALRVSASSIEALPWPAGPLDTAADLLRHGDVAGCGVAALGAYGIDPDTEVGVALVAWWSARRPAG